MENVVFIGKEIRRELKRQGRSGVWLARQLPCSNNHVYKLFSKKTMDADLLWRISDIMDVNFFRLYMDKWERRRRIIQNG
ncbi:MAG: XRE family transcriptional regulator [Paludibacteraceae bacterium]|nr:XRE family transcriptional regulator [Paludibacteraceae bacterium]